MSFHGMYPFHFLKLTTFTGDPTMIEQHFRLIFNGFIENASHSKIVDILNKDLGLSELAIKTILTSPPRIIAIVENLNDARKIRDTIEEAGGRIYMEQMVEDASCPFPLSKKKYNRMYREIQKASRGQYGVTLLGATVNPKDPDATPASMLNDMDIKAEEYLKGFSSAYSVDDYTLLVIECFTEAESASDIQVQFDTALNSIFGNSVTVTSGISSFPDDADSLSGLLKIVKDKLEQKPFAHSTPVRETPKGNLSLDIITSGESALEMYQQAMITSRGKKFKWLTQQPLDELWLGLGGLPPVRQKEFLYRLPVDLPLVAELDTAIKKKIKPSANPESLRRIDEILIRMGGLESDETHIDIKDEIPILLKKVDSFPTLSAVAGKIAAIAKDPDSTIDELTEVIKNDPALTLTLLKIVNSAFYGFPQKIETIERAVIILGRDEVVNLSLGLAASKAIDITPVKGLYQPKTLWHHLMGTALTCRYLCSRFNQKDETGLFTAGLLHDFGKIFLVDHYPDIYGKLHIDAAEYNIPLYELEEEVFGVNHALIGKAVASYWNLPEPLIQAAAFHHQPFFATDQSRLPAIVGFADILYHKAWPSTEIGQVVTPHSPCLTYGHWIILEQVFPGIAMEDIDTMTEEVTVFIEENQQVFSVLAVNP